MRGTTSIILKTNIRNRYVPQIAKPASTRTNNTRTNNNNNETLGFQN